MICIMTTMMLNFNANEGSTEYEGDNSLHLIIYCLLFEHILSYGIMMYRKRDIAQNGKHDSYGVVRAHNEYIL